MPYNEIKVDILGWNQYIGGLSFDNIFSLTDETDISKNIIPSFILNKCKIIHKIETKEIK